MAFMKEKVSMVHFRSIHMKTITANIATLVLYFYALPSMASAYGPVGTWLHTEGS